jgi:hypothetical protein
MASSRTPEGPLNFCPVCGKHCRIEPSPESLDATCPRCGSLLWPDPRVGNSRLLSAGARPAGAERYWEPWTLQQFGYQDSTVIAWADIRAWEGKFGVELPGTLAKALVVQNGGRLLGTEIDILPILRFGTLDHGEWVGLLRKEFPSPSDRARLIYVGWLPGGSAVLDYRQHSEPRVRNMDPIFDGELRREYSSFDEVVRLSRRQRAGA